MNCPTWRTHSRPEALDADADAGPSADAASLRGTRARLPTVAAFVIAVASSLVMTFAG